MTLTGLDLPDETATAALGASLARQLRRGDAICLSGPLGAGKSTLARAMIRAATSAEEEVPSPTFTLVQTYEGTVPIAHFDLYRLSHLSEIDELGLQEALDEGVAVIEWPERLEGRLPLDRLEVALGFVGEARRARLAAFGTWVGRL